MSALRKSRVPRPVIGIVSEELPLASRIKATLQASGYRVAFTLRLDELEKDAAGTQCAGVVVSGEPRSRNSNEFGRVRDRLPKARIVACMAPVNIRGLRMAVDLGIDGVVWTSELEQTLDATVRAVLAGQLVVPRDSYRSLDSTRLTSREKQCLSLMIMGLTNQEIAQKLFLAEATVKSHLNAAYRKLGVHSRTEAAKLITDPAEGLGTGILAITGPGLARGLKPRK